MVRQGNKQKETIVNLRDVTIGQVFRFASDEFSDALVSRRFFMRVNPNGEKAKRILVVELTGHEVREFDDNHQVIIHNHEFVVFP